MSQRAVDFLEAFVNQHVNPVPSPDHQVEAEALAQRCLEEAKKLGISEEEFEEDLGQDLISEFVDRLDARMDEEIARLPAKDSN